MVEGKNVFNKSHHGLEKANRADTAVFRPWEFWEPYHEHPWFRILWYTGCRMPWWRKLWRATEGWQETSSEFKN